MRYIDVVAAEGEPLLIGDAKVVRRGWQGTEGNGSDYERAWKLLAGRPGYSLLIGQTQSIIWDMEGAGTADVFIDPPDGILIIRVWIHDPDEMKAVLKLAALPKSTSIAIGTLSITSGLLVILSSVESGECVQASNVVLSAEESGRPSGDMATRASGLLLRVPTGSYLCEHDEVELEDGQSARRCFLIRESG